MLTRGLCLVAAGHQLVGGVQLFFTCITRLFCGLFCSLVFFFFFNVSSFPLYHCYYCCCYIIINKNIIIAKLLLSQPTSFLTFTFPLLLLLILVGGKWASTCVVLSCLLGLNHDSTFEDHLVQPCSSSRAIPRSVGPEPCPGSFWCLQKAPQPLSTGDLCQCLVNTALVEPHSRASLHLSITELPFQPCLSLAKELSWCLACVG